MTFNWPDMSQRKALVDEPRLVCWTRMQAEAGQVLQQIIRRKELERQSGNGVFFWGVGNAPASSVGTLARAQIPIPVIFSVMKSKPKREDAEADEIFAWLGYVDARGHERSMPPHAIVLSRARTPKGLKKNHYSLICHSDTPLQLDEGEVFDLANFRNVGGRSAPVGSSQVTALLKPSPANSDGSSTPYRVAMRASLIDGYWVRLTRPVLLPTALTYDIASFDRTDLDDWTSLADRVRSLGSAQTGEPELLL